MIQQGVSVGGVAEMNEGDADGMTIGRVMDWIEARLEAVKSREEEEEEDEEKAPGGTKSKDVRLRCPLFMLIDILTNVNSMDSHQSGPMRQLLTTVPHHPRHHAQQAMSQLHALLNPVTQLHLRLVRQQRQRQQLALNCHHQNPKSIAPPQQPHLTPDLHSPSHRLPLQMTLST
jgi:hypothetical protein